MALNKFITKVFNTIQAALEITDLLEQVIEAKFLTARVLLQQMKLVDRYERLSDAEFKVFSQFGDDGIIQYLIHKIGIPEDQQRFIEFGVQDYQESNTRFLLMNNNWSGLIFDGDHNNIEKATKDRNYWRYDLTARTAFVDQDNINSLLVNNKFAGDIGLLSIDIDGNDYWIWERIDVINPIIVIIEYNSTFGNKYAVTVPYDPKFQRSVAHCSNLYWGASLKALCILAARKGFAFIGSNSAGNNAYFVRLDQLSNLVPLTAEQGYVEAKFRESRNYSGKLSFLSGNDKIKEIGDMFVYDVETNRQVCIADLYHL